ncbi:gonadal protein gdl-ORF39 [Drosophila ficusphila]|nr:gonadal protein gdl-ORF39 [Drosophila ficusphila]
MWATNLLVVTLLLVCLAALANSCSCGEAANLDCGCTKPH